MTEPAPRVNSAAHGPHVYGVSRYATPNEYERPRFFLAYVLLEALLLVGSFVFVIINLNTNILKGTPVLVAIGFLAIIVAIARPAFKHLTRFFKEMFINEFTYLKIYRVRNAAEDAVVRELCANLDSEWTVFRNVVLPPPSNDKKGRGTNIDLVLVGPAGIFAIEVEHDDPPLPLARRAQFNPKQHHWYAERHDPFGQPVSYAHHLNAYLRSQGIGELKVAPVLVLSQSKVTDNFYTNRRERWLPADLSRIFRALASGADFGGKTLSDTTRTRVLTILHNLLPQSATVPG